MALSNKAGKIFKKGLGDRIYDEAAEVAEMRKRAKKLKPLPHSKPKPATITPKFR